MSGKFSMDDYIDVAERIQDFKDAHPEGSLQTISWEVSNLGTPEKPGPTFVVYRAAAYRHPDDPRPGHGIAWEPFPGTTSFTKNSELMNAETAAWGRAIVALGLTANRKLASRQEVRARVEEQAQDHDDSKPVSRGRTPTQGKTQATPPDGHSGAKDKPQADGDGTAPVSTETTVSTETLEALVKAHKDSGLTVPQLKAICKEAGAEGKKLDQLTEDQATWVILKVKGQLKT